MKSNYFYISPYLHGWMEDLGKQEDLSVGQLSYASVGTALLD